MLDLLKDTIKTNQGSIPFSKFMEVVLYDKKYGYYFNKQVIGSVGGDFITSPEISQLFGESLAVWVADQWSKLGSPSNFMLVDLGPGKGTMMQDILRALSKLPEVFNSIKQVAMLEISSLLIQEQKTKLLKYQNISWYETLDSLPIGMPTIFIGNEFLDALPIDQFVYRKEGWQEKRVLCENERLEFCYEPTSLKLGQAEIGEVLEINTLAKTLVKDIRVRINKFGGKAILIDYGYTERPGMSTVQAVKKHKYHKNILEEPGSADITSYVDFTALGLSPVISQRDFLASVGFFELANLLVSKTSKEQQFELVLAVDRLTSPLKMGGMFKVAQL